MKKKKKGKGKGSSRSSWEGRRRVFASTSSGLFAQSREMKAIRPSASAYSSQTQTDQGTWHSTEKKKKELATHMRQSCWIGF
jgi:hypothetical protein